MPRGVPANGRRKRSSGRPKKAQTEGEALTRAYITKFVEPESTDNKQVSQSETVLTEESQSETQSEAGAVMEAAFKQDLEESIETQLMYVRGAMQFTSAEIERIKSSDEVLLITKNDKRFENGKKDRQEYDVTWLKDVL